NQQANGAQNQQTAGAQNQQATNAPNQQPGANQANPQNQTSTSGVMPFTDIRQLLNVPGVTPDVVAAATPFITVFGGDKVNALTASPQVLAMLPGMTEDRVAAFVEARRHIPKGTPQIAMILGGAQNYAAIGRQTIA